MADSREIPEISDYEFSQEVLGSQEVVIVFVTVEGGCPPCRTARQHIQDLADKSIGTKFVIMQARYAELTCARFEVNAVPTTLVFKAEELRLRLRGDCGRDGFAKHLKPWLYLKPWSK